MIRRTLLSTAVLALLIGLLPAAAAAGDRSSDYQALGCFRDVEGDAEVPQADLVELCVRYFEEEGDQPAVVVLVFAAAADIDPGTDPAWQNPRTAASAVLDTDGDDEPDATFTITREGDQLVGVVADPDGEPIDGCSPLALTNGESLLGQIEVECLDGPDAIAVGGMLAYEVDAGGAVIVDRLPDDGVTAPLPAGDEPPVCDNARVEPGAQLTIRRLACGGVIAGTEPISQGVATSQFVFDDPATPQIDPYEASWAVIARDDDFADALAGSSLSFGQGPLLFTHSPASAAALGVDPNVLADITRAELLRTLRRGSTVYLMGGEAALAPGLDVQLRELGYEVVRFAGTGREGTARLVSAEVDRLVTEFSAATGFPDTNMVLIATRSNWPDAVVAGSVGAFWGMPILLVNADPPVHPDTLAALDELRPDYIHVIGGTGVITNDAGRAIGDHARGNGYALGRPGEDLAGPRWGSFCGGSFVCRWGGSNRIQTSGAVGQLNRDMVNRFAELTPLIPENQQQYAAAINLSSSGPNYAYALSAATVSGRFGGAVFIPTENGTLTPDIVNALCYTPGSEEFIERVEEVILVADTDVLSDSFAAEIRNLVEGGCPPPSG
jgi:hypothetical protein